MKINLPKTVRVLELQGYDPENAALTGVGIHVWVDPPRAVLQEYDRINRQFASLLQKSGDKPVKKTTLLDLLARRKALSRQPAVEAYHQALYAWYARMWSQGPEGTHWNVSELSTISAENPAFWEWLERSTWLLIEEHRGTIKKGLRLQAQTPPTTEEPATPPSQPITPPSTSTLPPADPSSLPGKSLN